MTITELPPYICQVCGVLVDHDDAVLIYDNGGRLLLVTCQQDGPDQEA